MMKKILSLLFAFAMLFSAALAEESTPYQIGAQVDDFELTLMDGSVFSLSETLQAGKAVILNLWTSWCPYCLKELPALNEAVPEIEDRAVLIAVDYWPEDTAEMMQTLRDGLGLENLSMAKVSYDFVNRFDLDAIPFTLVIDTSGVLRYTQEGSFRSKKQFIETVSPYFEAEAAPAGETQTESEIYRLCVTDEAGCGLEGVVLQLCDDTCRIVTTDALGNASIEADHRCYVVHVLKAPEGYAASEEERVLCDETPLLTFVLAAADAK